MNIFIFLFMIIISYNSCSSKPAQSADASGYHNEDTIKRIYSAQQPSDTIVLQISEESKEKLVSHINESTINTQQVRKAVFRKEVKPIEVDTMRKFRRDSVYKKLEDTEYKIKAQQKTLDSLILIKGK